MRISILALLLMLAVGCKTTRLPETASGPHFRLLSYNVNWGAPRPDLALEIIRRSQAEIVCLQETTPAWEQYLRSELRREFQFMDFRDSEGRAGGGLAFLSKVPAREVAYIRSDTGWFDGWIMGFETAVGPVQVINVHLQPPVGQSGRFGVSGYLWTSDERQRELQRFYRARNPGIPTIVAGDFNESETSSAVRWLTDQGLDIALPEFDRRTPTWRWRTAGVTLQRRMDHILYSPELYCFSARVILAGASDHYPVEAVFGRATLVRARHEAQ